MDPNAALQEARAALARARELGEELGPEHEDVLVATDEALMHYNELDLWLANGGFLPNAWLFLPEHESSRQADLRMRLAAENAALRDEVRELRRALEGQ